MAHTRPLGTFCKIVYDTDYRIAEGDVVRTSAGTCYRVVEVRDVTERSIHFPYRKNLTCVRIASEDVEEDDYIHPLFWYKRG